MFSGDVQDDRCTPARGVSTQTHRECEAFHPRPSEPGPVFALMTKRDESGYRVAFELIEIAAAADHQDTRLVGMFDRLERSVGFDTASFASMRGDDWLAYRKPASTIALCAQLSAQIKQETELISDPAQRCRDVILDREVYSASQRDRSLMFAEFLRPCGITSIVAVFLRRHSVPEHFLTFGRYGGRPFSETDLGLLRTLQPTFQLALRVPAPSGVHDLGLAAPVLTRRERELVAYVGRGLYNREIAALLGISALTVRNELSKIFRKFEVSTRAELTARAAQLGLLMA